MERAMITILGTEFAEFHHSFYEKDPAMYGKDVRERLERAIETPWDEYVRALREQELIRRESSDLLQWADAILLPAIPCTAVPIATLTASVNSKAVPYLRLHRPFLTSHNLTGFPALFTPMGFSREDLPLLLQIVGRPWEETTVLGVAHAYKRLRRIFATAAQTAC
jgi:aspartyl-tRNA(Asn)/glutamyl-tRNA(Gln) amidotransferase subunit A